jgi:hypothetical protein
MARARVGVRIDGCECVANGSRGDVAAFQITHSHIVHDQHQIAHCNIVSNWHVHVEHTITVIGDIYDASIATPTTTLVYRLLYARSVVD